MSDPQSTYIANTEDDHEVARLLVQDRAFTQAMGEVFAQEQWTQIFRVLDLACGPGGWILDMAHRYPHAQFVGIDTSEHMLKYATMFAQAEATPNVHVERMNVIEPLTFPDASFDFANGRLLLSSIAPPSWPTMLQECMRILRPGGHIRLTDYELTVTNSKAIERLCAIFMESIFRAGLGFSVSGRSSGSFMLPTVLTQAGFLHVQQRGFMLECSYGSPEFETWKEDFLLMCHTFLPFIRRIGSATEEEVITLREQALRDMELPSFCETAFCITTWAHKARAEDEIIGRK